MVIFSAVDLDRSIQGISPYDRAKRVTSSFLVPFSDRHGHCRAALCVWVCWDRLGSKTPF